jgi:hypothetical protein
MKVNSGPEYRGDGIVSGTALSSSAKGNQHRHVRVQTFVVDAGSAAILEGDLVDIVDTVDGTSGVYGAVEKHTASAATSRRACGGATHGATAGQLIEVMLEGFMPNANVVTAEGTVGNLLGPSATAGRLGNATAPSATVPGPVAICTIAAAANVGGVRWLNPLRL